MKYNNTTLRKGIFIGKWAMLIAIALVLLVTENHQLAGLLFCVAWVIVLLSTFQYFWNIFRRL